MPMNTAAALALLLGAGTAAAAPITYQGTLEDNGAPANGLYDMRFTLADAPVLGLALQFIDIDDVQVVDGLFEVEVDFEDAHFTGADRWLGVRIEGISLNPRTKINYAPYAIRATRAQQADVALDLDVPWVVVTDTDVVNATSSRGVPLRGRVSSTSLNNPGVLGETNSLGSGAIGVHGRTNSDASHAFSVGVRGDNAGMGRGVHGNSSQGVGVLGTSSSGTGVSGTAQFGAGVFGSSQNDAGVNGFSVFYHGVRGRTTNGLSGVWGLHETEQTWGLLGTEDYGVHANNTATDGEGTALLAEGGRIGVRGVALPDGFGADLTRVGVDGFAGGFSTGANMIYGVRGFAQNPASGGSRTAYGVYGGAQVGNSANTAYGVYGESVGPGGTQYAGYFSGNVHVLGTLSKSSGSFKIDHPLDPENAYLSHSFVESPEMLNVYSGTALLDATGSAFVTLPDYFQALNTDFRYQLTAVGAPMPNLYIASEVSGNQFAISGGQPGAKVSWQVSGVRQDVSAKAHPIIVEEMKAPQHRGKFLDPAAYGAGDDRAIHPAPTRN